MHSMTNRAPARRLALAITLALTLGVFLVALLGPAQTLAQTHKPACPTSAHAKKRGARACTQPSHKVKAQARHAAKHHAKRTPKTSSKKTSKTSAPAAAAVAAECEDGSAPVRAEGSFSCADGSEPQCEDGATPTPSHNGRSLVCPVAAEDEANAGEAECEEEALGCTPGSSSGSGEQACEAAAGDSSSFVCEDES